MSDSRQLLVLQREKVLDSLKEILTYDQYHKYSVDLVTKYYNSTKLFKTNLTLVKKSNSFQTGLMIKKILKNTHLLKLSKKIFKYFLKFKA